MRQASSFQSEREYKWLHLQNFLVIIRSKNLVALTDYIWFWAESWSFLWPEKRNWAPHLNNRAHFSFAWASFFVKHNLFSFNIICHSSMIINSPFQVTAAWIFTGKTFTTDTEVTHERSQKYQFAYRQEKSVIQLSYLRTIEAWWFSSKAKLIQRSIH